MRTVKAIFVTNDRLYRENKDGEKQSMIVKLNPSYAPNTKDANHDFWQATPTGSMEMQINNPNVFDLFIPGKQITLTFTFDDDN
jgi:hypothetical protein